MCSMPFVISRARDAVSEHQSRALRVMESSVARSGEVALLAIYLKLREKGIVSKIGI